MPSDSLDDAISRIHTAWDAGNTREDAVDDQRWQRRQARFGSAWADVMRYRSYLRFALEDRMRFGVELARPDRTPGGLFGEEAKELLARTHYTIESFFLLGKILLDRVALAIEASFGNAVGFRPRHVRRRGSHRRSSVVRGQ